MPVGLGQNCKARSPARTIVYTTLYDVMTSKLDHCNSLLYGAYYQ